MRSRVCFGFIHVRWIGNGIDKTQYEWLRLQKLTLETLLELTVKEVGQCEASDVICIDQWFYLEVDFNGLLELARSSGIDSD